MKQTSDYHLGELSTFHVATLLMAPQYCWFPDNSPLLSPGYVNSLEKMINLNKQIVQFNNDQFKKQSELFKRMSPGVVGTKDKTPMYHTYGVRSDKITRDSVMTSVKTHHWEI